MIQTRQEPPKETPVFFVRARVKALSCLDGAVALKPGEARVGKVYLVDIYTRRTILAMTPSGPQTTDLMRCPEDGGWLPVECVELLP